VSHRFAVGDVLCGVQSCDSTEANVFFNSSTLGSTVYARMVDGAFCFERWIPAPAKAFFAEHKKAYVQKIAELNG
jgi:hypothetical protein